MDKRTVGATVAGGVVAAVIALVVESEGTSLKAYPDPGGIWTICEGITRIVRDGIRRPVRQGDIATPAECKTLVDYEVRAALAVVNRCTPGQPEPVQVAMGDFVYNLGPEKYCTSTMARYLSEGRVQAACNELQKWRNARVAGKLVPFRGLVTRRGKDKVWCDKGLAHVG